MLNATVDAFQNKGDLAGAQPLHRMPSVPGGVLVAVVGGTHMIKGVYYVVREAALFPKAKAKAICLGSRRIVNGSEHREPCPFTAATLEELAALHPTPGQLAKSNTQHVIALWSDEKLDPDAYLLAKQDHDERAKALNETKSFVEKQALLAQWRTERLSDPRRPFPEPLCIGLMSDERFILGS